MTAYCHFQRSLENVQTASDWLREGYFVGSLTLKANKPAKMSYFRPIRGIKNISDTHAHTHRHKQKNILSGLALQATPAKFQNINWCERSAFQSIDWHCY